MGRRSNSDTQAPKTASHERLGLLVPKKLVSAGKIHLLGLEDVQQRLDKKWNRMSELVHRYFEAAIRREVGSDDSFVKVDELSYLLLLRESSLAEAELKCAKISGEVCEHLFGENAVDVSTRSLTLPVNDADLSLAAVQRAMNALLEKEGREARFYLDHQSASSDVHQNIRVQLDTDFEQTHYLPIENPDFLYRPIWDSVRGIIVTYLVQALPDTLASTTSLSGFCIAENEGDQALLDRLTLMECLDRASILRESGLKIQFAVPLHFNTLAREKFWSKYSATLNTTPKDILKYIFPFVCGVYFDIPNFRLARELPKLNVISRHTFCVVDNTNDRPDGIASISRQFQNTNIYALGLTRSKEDPEKVWMQKLSRVCKDSRRMGFETFALGAAERSAAVNAIGAGARFIEGPGVRRPTADPKFGYIQEVEDLYRDIKHVTAGNSKL